ncbi:hypothetical protein PALB_28650 [Pseudoalteromonas luteoviolacea B = ATCC 29581]|nr:hypothetical protein PALB_28650 [Pseudoalteromonas luteoviolacea B = ATCC 29581]
MTHFRKHSLAVSLLSLLTLNACQVEHRNLEKLENAPRLTNNIQVPAPSQLQVDIDVSGRTSTLNHIDIKFVGQSIPSTYSNGKVTNSRGYNWWVSKHFALKSDLPEEQVRLYLELLELAYPHYVELFGQEPNNIENQRIAVVYGSSRARVKEAMLDDGFLRGVHDTAGGETMFYNRAGYNFPSHRYHHQRYIVIHETMHAFHMALNGHSTWAPNWITEGLADSIAHHVYDPNKKQLNVMVFDRAPMNYLITGLNQYYRANRPTIEQINDDPSLKRGLNFFIIHFLLNDPERALYFKLFLNRLMRANPHSEATLPTANRLLKETFNDWQALETDFAHFVANIKPTFVINDGPWEQNGPFYWVRNNDSTDFASIDIVPQMKFGMPVIDQPYVAQCGEKCYGIEINFVKPQMHRGEVGFTLLTSFDKDTLAHRNTFVGQSPNSEHRGIEVIIKDGTELHVTLQGTKSRVFALSTDLLTEVVNSGSLRIETKIDNAIRFTLFANNAKQLITLPVETKNSLSPLGLRLLSKNSNHLIAPILPFVSQTGGEKATTSNPFGIENWQSLYDLFATCKDFSDILLQCDEQMRSLFNAFDEDNPVLNIRIDELKTTWSLQLRQGTDKTHQQALASLFGLKTSLYFNGESPQLKIEHSLKAVEQSTLRMTFKTQDERALATEKTSHSLSQKTNIIPIKTPNKAHRIQIEGKISKDDVTFSFSDSFLLAKYDGVWLNAKPTVSNDKLAIDAMLSGPYSGKTAGTLELRYLSVSQNIPSPLRQIQDVDLAPYENKTWHFHLKRHSEMQSEDLIVIEANLDVDGEPIKLTKSFRMRELM